MKFKSSRDEVSSLYATWAEILRHARGVYLSIFLVRRDTGEQYVGSANGADGFHGRWCNYADGHGGNVAMKELKAPASTFDVSIFGRPSRGPRASPPEGAESAASLACPTSAGSTTATSAALHSPKRQSLPSSGEASAISAYRGSAASCQSPCLQPLAVAASSAPV